ncbi:hypothetical protein HA402_001303 [Bradysia odoriphaga]|nr:hypothetical protein HA402_001303 [Bradysia odoriphaga]
MMDQDLQYIFHGFKDRKGTDVDELTLEKCLASEGIKSWQLIDGNDLEKYLNVKDIKDNNVKINKFPLEWFDNNDYEIMAPEQWLNLHSDVNEYKLPAVAFIPYLTHRNARTLIFSTNFIEWEDVNVEGYSHQNRLWTVRDSAGKIHQVPRIHLKFYEEHTLNFVKRISDALWRRENAEKWVKFELLADCLNVDKISDPKMELMDRIKKLSLPKKLDDRDWFFNIREELILNYKRTLGLTDLRKAIESHPSKFPNINLPFADQTLEKQESVDLSCLYDFQEKRRVLKFINLFPIAHAFSAMLYVIDECDKVGQMSLFTNISHKTASLANFKSIEETFAIRTVDFLRAVWPVQLANLITMVLRRAGKGWYDIEISTWEIYNLAKIKRFLSLVKFHMESALRRLVENTILLYSDMLYKPCISFVDIPEDYIWNDSDLITSPFDPHTSHVFYLTLQMNETGAFYSIDPSTYGPVIMELYETYLERIHFVPLVDPKIMKGLTFDPDLYLSSVGLMEAMVIETRENLKKAYDKCVIPLTAYAKKYDRHVALFVMNVSSYLEDFEKQNKNAPEIRDEIIFQRAMKKMLEQTLPTSIQIGTFLINVSPIKNNLVAKRQELADLMMDYLVRKLNNETNAILSEYNAILKTLSEKPTTIEKLYKTTEWMETIPGNVSRLENVMKMKLFDFAILDDFYFALPNANFNAKVQALYSPVKISNQIKITNEMFAEEIQRFRKQQIEDLATYNERLEELTVSVVYYNTQFDVGKLVENSIEIRKLWKAINEFGELGEVLNKRQKLFELPEIDLQPIKELIISSNAFRDLWCTAADFNKFVDILLENTLTNVSVKNVHEEMERFESILKKSVQSFREQEKIQDVAQYFLDKVKNFYATVDCLILVKNTIWNINHWQELGARTGMEIKLPLTRNFNYFLNKGILSYVEEVKSILNEAMQAIQAIQENEDSESKQ